MSFGKMNTTISFFDTLPGTDDEGFKDEIEVWLMSIKAYREGRHGTEKWANRATFTDATDLFRFRKTPGFLPTTAMFIECNGTRFEITSVEDVKGRGLYMRFLQER